MFHDSVLLKRSAQTLANTRAPTPRACACCLRVRTCSGCRRPFGSPGAWLWRKASIHPSSWHPGSAHLGLRSAGCDLGRGFRARGVKGTASFQARGSRRGEEGTRVRGLQPSSSLLAEQSKREGDFQGRRPRLLRPFLRGDATGFVSWASAARLLGWALLSTRATSRSRPNPTGGRAGHFLTLIGRTGG